MLRHGDHVRHRILDHCIIPRGELRYRTNPYLHTSTYYGYLKLEAHKDPQPWPWPPKECGARREVVRRGKL